MGSGAIFAVMIFNGASVDVKHEFFGCDVVIRMQVSVLRKIVI